MRHYSSKDKRRISRNSSAASGSAFRFSEREHGTISGSCGFGLSQKFPKILLDFLHHFVSRQNDER